MTRLRLAWTVPYHHGDLRAVLLSEAASVVAADGPDALTLRGLARRAGVSHAAPAHHFRDRRGLLTALATEGFVRLERAMRSAPTFLETAVAYVEFATGAGRGHYAVMFDSSRTDPRDPDLEAARTAAGQVLLDGTGTVEPRSADAPLAAFALVHGLATLVMSGALRATHPGADVGDLTRRAARVLFAERSDET
ncbi:TetR/AcrR family transcriptional regulator [Sanguibacter suaedae]|uniref:TetR/AcrR family transcriptional regulator n=1 Tax=Sanguibacter suaedae TaxID=2795737 RepID=A0A934I584_9MICO|nr:TetR/AcrR family transcriptional regulator [Sanguibacter suaedae]MBI9113402.1 TetR/AcrR family transcriptional regulator [Sanguibacter suaedae]